MHHLILIILSAILCMPSFASSTLCFDHDNPLNPWQRTLVECSGTENSRPLRKRRSDQSAFKIDFTCYAQDHVCQRARRAFDHAGVLISQAIAFKTPVTVNATFIPFCQGLGECPKGHLVTLGGSYPARTVALTQSHGVVRLYPQALVKQMDVQSHPSYGPYDIVSLFNAEAPFWFEDDGLIRSDQSDFLFVILHEFMHGLGFYSNWHNPFAHGMNALTPDITPLLNGERLLGMNETNGAIVLTSVLESVFDQFMVTLPDMKRTSSITHKFNQVRFRRNQTLLASLEQSGLLAEAQAMYEFGTKAESLGFAVPGNDSTVTLVLETGLTPFQSGSSISHVDYALYSDTADFLMRFMQDPGLTLDQVMKTSSSSSPIGPQLRKVLKAMGYDTLEYITIQQNLSHSIRLNATNSGHRNKQKIGNKIIPVTILVSLFCTI